MLPKRGAGRSNFGKIAQARKQSVETGGVFDRDAYAGLFGEIAGSRDFVELRQPRNDELCHQAPSEARSFAMCALCSSSVTNSPRSTAASASST